VKEGDVILTQIPQSDGTLKSRPALVLRELPPFRDLLVCGISTQTHQAVGVLMNSYYALIPTLVIQD
jgi:mRNA interferase MazF